MRSLDSRLSPPTALTSEGGVQLECYTPNGLHSPTVTTATLLYGSPNAILFTTRRRMATEDNLKYSPIQQMSLESSVGCVLSLLRRLYLISDRSYSVLVLACSPYYFAQVRSSSSERDPRRPACQVVVRRVGKAHHRGYVFRHLEGGDVVSCVCRVQDEDNKWWTSMHCAVDCLRYCV